MRVVLPRGIKQWGESKGRWGSARERVRARLAARWYRRLERQRATLPPAVVAAVWPLVTVTVGEAWHAPRPASRPVASAGG
jgi:hypothetical protein